MSYGVTADGFVKKTLAVLKAELEDEARSTFGAGVNLDARQPLGQWIGILAERHASLWELAEAVCLSHYPDTAEGVPLDNAVALTGISRKPATFSTLVATAFGDAATVVPQGTVFSVDGDESARFATDEDATIAAAVSEVQTITFSGLPDSGNWDITFSGQTTSSLAHNANAAAVQAALRALSNISADLTVTGDYVTGFVVTFAGADTGVDQPLMTTTDTLQTSAPAAITITVTETTKGAAPQIDIACTAETAGAVQAPAATLTVIETPVSGLDTVTNAEDAEVGEDEETDAELKLRRADSLQKAGAGTLEAIRADLLQLDNVTAAIIFENTTDTVDGDGRPAHSFEAIVEGGDDQEIADRIWIDKPAGIATHGTETVSVEDSQGFSHDVKFSRPADLDIYLDIDYVLGSEAGDFPDDGEALLVAAAVAFGAGLTIGKDVIVNGYASLMKALSDVPGIVDLTIRIGTAADPTLDSNVTVGVGQRAKFDSGRIIVLDVTP